ncbi:hypothetical protein N7539_003529 [Penicillium diatomitis]|uniref:Uncharacterized protein n=1 Tax=Penicillium diatomitis TaxID=2819901 RepID=A0A9X0BXM2_9EURO|nr:uncharacterized protein N7539_003529 [Penicillium diatomitis]KAJ5488639.1 hypothetical protein N7539_003529 [Penicillium diatomitis]
MIRGLLGAMVLSTPSKGSLTPAVADAATKSLDDGVMLLGCLKSRDKRFPTGLTESASQAYDCGWMMEGFRMQAR